MGLGNKKTKNSYIREDIILLQTPPVGGGGINFKGEEICAYSLWTFTVLIFLKNFFFSESEFFWKVKERRRGLENSKLE